MSFLEETKQKISDWHTQVPKNYQWAIAFIIIAILFIIIGHYYREQIQLALKRELFKLPASSVDLWSLSHFALFFLYGYLIPNHHVKFLILGILWEITEDLLASDANTQLADCSAMKSCEKNKLRGILCNGFQDGYWYGKWDDIVFNTVGYILGSAMAN